MYIWVILKYVFRSLSYSLKEMLDIKKKKTFRKCSLESEILEYWYTSRLIPIECKTIRDNHEILDYIKQWLFLAVGLAESLWKMFEKVGQDLHRHSCK